MVLPASAEIETLAKHLYDAWKDAADRVDPYVRRGDSERTTIYAPRLQWRSLPSTQRLVWTAVARRAAFELGHLETASSEDDDGQE